MIHELVHVAVLVFTLCGAASLLLVLLWPLVGEKPLPRPTKTVMAVLVGLAVTSLLLEWFAVH